MFTKNARLGVYRDTSSLETPSSYNWKDERCKGNLLELILSKNNRLHKKRLKVIIFVLKIKYLRH